MAPPAQTIGPRWSQFRVSCTLHRRRRTAHLLGPRHRQGAGCLLAPCLRRKSGSRYRMDRRRGRPRRCVTWTRLLTAQAHAGWGRMPPWRAYRGGHGAAREGRCGIRLSSADGWRGEGAELLSASRQVSLATRPELNGEPTKANRWIAHHDARGSQADNKISRTRHHTV